MNERKVEYSMQLMLRIWNHITEEFKHNHAFEQSSIQKPPCSERIYTQMGLTLGETRFLFSARLQNEMNVALINIPAAITASNCRRVIR